MSEHGHGPVAPGPAPTEPTADPSMEDILASIRRILNEEDAKPPEPGAPASDPADTHDDEVLQLDAAMLVPEEGPALTEQPIPSPPVPSPGMPPSMAQAVIAVPPAPEPPPPPAVPMPPMMDQPLAVPFPMPTLVAPEAAASAAASVSALMRTLATERSTAVHRGGPTLEDLVREEMRPLVKEWLDHHLAPMVERLVRAEIERVVSRTQ